MLNEGINVPFFKKKSTGDKGIAFFLAKVSPRQKKKCNFAIETQSSELWSSFLFLKSDSGRARL